MHIVEANDGAGRPADGSGVTHPPSRPGPFRRRRRARRIGRRSAVTLALLVAISTAASGCRPPSCTEPFPAAMWQEDVTDPAPWPTGGTARPEPRSLFDTDADGMEDMVEGATGEPVIAVTVHRAAGNLVFVSEFGVVAPVRQLGSDHDGDGRSDIILAAATENGHPGRTYVIPGSTLPGTYDPADAGIRLVDSWLPTDDNRVGDLDGDGADDLVFTGDFETWVFDGAEIMAAGPGEDYPFSPVILSGALANSVQITPNLYALVRVDDPDEVVLRVGEAELRFTTANSGLPVSQNDFANLGASIVDGPDGEAWLVVWVDGTGGTVTARWAWDLDSVCDGSTPPTMVDGEG
jgi:hypothetical protein